MKLQTIINKNANSSVDKKTRVLSCNFGEFMEMMDDCKGGYHSNDAHSRTFHGTDKMAKSFEASKELLWKGYQPDAMKSTMDGFDTEFESRNPKSVMVEEGGFDFDVPSIMSNADRVWFDNQTKGQTPSIHIVYQANANGGCKAMNFYIQAAVIRKLCEVLGEDCLIKASAIYCSSKSAKKGKESYSTGVCLSVKDYDEMFDERRVGATAHPSFFRRLIFATRDCAGDFFGEGFKAHPFFGASRNPSVLGIDEEFLSQEMGADLTIRIPMPSSHHFANVDNAVDYCKKIIGDAKKGVAHLKGNDFEDDEQWANMSVAQATKAIKSIGGF